MHCCSLCSVPVQEKLACRTELAREPKMLLFTLMAEEVGEPVRWWHATLAVSWVYAEAGVQTG